MKDTEEMNDKIMKKINKPEVNLIALEAERRKEITAAYNKR